MGFLIFISVLLFFWIFIAIIGKNKSLNDTSSSSLFGSSALPPNVNSRTVFRFGKITYQTKSLNKLLLFISKKGKQFWQIWFSLGVFFGFFALILSTIILLVSFTISIYSLIHNFNVNNNSIDISIHPMVSVDSNISNIGNSNLAEFNNTLVYQNSTFEYTKNEDNNRNSNLD